MRIPWIPIVRLWVDYCQTVLSDFQPKVKLLQTRFPKDAKLWVWPVIINWHNGCCCRLLIVVSSVETCREKALVIDRQRKQLVNGSTVRDSIFGRQIVERVRYDCQALIYVEQARAVHSKYGTCSFLHIDSPQNNYGWLFLTNNLINACVMLSWNNLSELTNIIISIEYHSVHCQSSRSIL